MSRDELPAIALDQLPEVSRIVAEARTVGRPVLLRRGHQGLAVLIPLPVTAQGFEDLLRAYTPKQIATFLRADELDDEAAAIARRFGWKPDPR